MARNPLGTDPAREQRVRERAYHLWEVDGKPHGRDVEYWERARELVSSEESADSGQAQPGSAAQPAQMPPSGAKRASQPETSGGTSQAQDEEPKAAPKRRSRAKPKKPA